MRNLLIALYALFIFSGCTQLSPPVDHRGIIQFVNNSNDNYEMWIQKSYIGIIQPRKSMEYRQSSGTKEIEVKQVNGYLLIPTKRKWVVSITEDQSQIVTFP